MAVPTFEERFEEGAAGAFDSTAGGISFVHVAEQARLNSVLPWQGAYMAKVTGAGTGDDSLVEGDYNISDDGTVHQKALLYFPSADLSLANGETFDLFVSESAADDEGSIRVRNNSGVMEIGVWSDKTGTSGSGTGEDYAQLPLDRWFQLELSQFVSDATGTGAEGSLTLFIDDTQVAQVSPIIGAAVTTATWGYQDGSDAGNSVVYYMDHLKFGTARFGGREKRWPADPYLTDSRHICFGPGRLSGGELIDGGSGDVTLKLFDTDEADTSDDRLVGQLTVGITGRTEFLMKQARFTRGLYAQLGGTSPEAYLDLARVQGYGSEGSIRNYMRKRRPRG